MPLHNATGRRLLLPDPRGNGSWAALLKAAAQSLRHCWDPKVARQVEAARETLPDDHSLAKRVGSILSEEKPRPN